MARQLLFVFDDETRAVIFVKRLLLNYPDDVAIMRDHAIVHVIDGAPRDRVEEITRLAKTSGTFRTDLPRTKTLKPC